jgi:hypothetical protein
MKKIPKLLLEHDKEHNKYDIYFLNREEDNKIDKKTIFGEKQQKKEWEKLVIVTAKDIIKNCNGKILVHDNKIIDKEGETGDLKYHFDHLGDSVDNIRPSRFSSAYARDDEEAKREEYNKSIVSR